MKDVRKGSAVDVRDRRDPVAVALGEHRARAASEDVIWCGKCGQVWPCKPAIGVLLELYGDGYFD